MVNRIPDVSFHWSGEKTLGTTSYWEKFPSFTITTVTRLTGLVACPQHWLGWGDSCYRAFKGPKSWNDSLTFCRENQADLASLNSAEENQFVFQNVDATKGIWIGLVKDKKLKLFRWTSEENVDFKNWHEEPVINGPDNCGEMVDYIGHRGKWHNTLCSKALAFICEKKGKAQYFSHTTFSRLKTRLCLEPSSRIYNYLGPHGFQEQIWVMTEIKEGKVKLPS